MSDEELAKRAICCKHWRWMPGMLQVVAPKQDGGTGCVVRYEGIAIPGAYPDLSDPATMGCLLSLVRESWAPARVVVYHQHGQPSWEINVELPDGSMPCVDSAASEGAVLVAALEAAERREVSDE